jgi:hypothetical protein
MVPEIDRARQATASLRGYIYQLHQSAAAWINLRDGDLLVLEAAEDYAEILKEPDWSEELLRATQVKNFEEGILNLNSPELMNAIDALFRLQEANHGRPIKLEFLTTANIGLERKRPLASGQRGLDVWSAAAEGGDVSEIRAALLARLGDGGLKTFVRGSTDEQLRQRVLSSLVFVCGASDWRQVAAENREALVRMRAEFHSSAAMAHQAYDAVIGKLVEKALSADRTLIRQDLLALLQRAASVPISSETVERLLSREALTDAKGPADISTLRALANGSIAVGKPPSIAALLRDADPTALAAFEAAERIGRTITSRDQTEKEINAATVPDLVDSVQKKHLIVGPPGSGKTHTLWQSASELLKGGAAIPIYLQAAQVDSWDDLAASITQLAPGVSLDLLFGDERVCFFIDGWSEFATGEHATEKRKALRVLRDARVIATAKFIETGESAFKIWDLELLSRSHVEAVLAKRLSGAPTLPDNVLDLLRLPLLLSMHLLAGANANEPGELLRQFHNRLVRALPQGLTEALADAVSSVRATRNAGVFRRHFDKRAQILGISNPVSILAQLGTITEQGPIMVPVHDLYWSWLAGVGSLNDHKISQMIGPLDSRGDLELAFQSGVAASEEQVVATQDSDLILAARLAANTEAAKIGIGLAARVDAALMDPHLSVRSRGALAALAGRSAADLARAFAVKSELANAQYYLLDWVGAFRPSELFAHRSTIADWIGSPGSEDLLSAIAERGGPEWSRWLQDIAAVGRVSPIDALAAALACDPRLPAWGLPHVDELIATKPWKLRATAARGANLELARYIAANYNGLVNKLSRGGAGWLDLNKVLLACYDDAIFGRLLDDFPNLDAQAQGYLGYAAVERGGPWIAAFQRIAFSKPGSQHHRLAEVVSLDIDDATARRWIEAGHAQVGWRVLIARHGEAILPELVAQLPASFGGIPDVPALAYLRYFKTLPTSVLPNLWGRLGSPMQPKVTQDLLNAASRVGEEGIASIVNFVLQSGAGLPAYFREQALRLYRDWQRSSGLNVWVGAPHLTPVPFDKLTALSAAFVPWEPHFSARLLAAEPDTAVAFVIGIAKQDVAKARAVLEASPSVKNYNADLLETMLSEPALATFVPNVFANAFDGFPAEAILRCLDSRHIQQETLLWRLSDTSNPLHRSVHAFLIHRVIQASTNFHHFRYVASMLRSHTSHTVRELLSECADHGSENWRWFVREVEIVRSERLVNEAGVWLS